MSDIKEIKTTEDRLEVYENDIALYLHQYCIDRDIEYKDLYTISQSRWNSVLLFVYKHVFKITDKDIKYNNKNSNIDYSNKDLVSSICDYYINMCFEYDKEISIVGFSNLTGISQDIIYNWGNKDNRASTSHFDIYKKLHDCNEESLSDKLVSGKGNPVGILGALNKRHNWNMGQPRVVEYRKIPEIPADREEKYLEIAAGKTPPKPDF